MTEQPPSFRWIGQRPVRPDGEDKVTGRAAFAADFTLPGLLKIKTVKKPAQKARKGVPNPLRPGETMDVAAKPASTKVKVLPLKKLKDMAM